ncbi:MAG TPA: tetratricopeptide repeat protein [Pseudomonadota bacterium]|nr:tetratricopeptide repeat protein [Pseudomonadota bacterium]
MSTLLAELQRRKVFKVGAAYLVVAWLVVQGASIGFPAFEAPPWALRVFILVLMLGFPIALVMAWVFETTPEGVVREDRPAGSMWMYAIAATLAVAAVGWFLLGRSTPDDEAGSLAIAGAKPPLTTTDSTSGGESVQAASKSIAVLAFTDLSPAKDQEYFSDGIAEEILNALVKVKGLKVAGRTSSFYYKGRNEDLRKIGETLGVAHILEGSVRKQGEKVRITAQLIQAADGFHLWSETYDGDLADVFELQERIARAITDELKVVLDGGQQQRLVPVATRNTEAYALYLQATGIFNRRDAERYPDAVTALEEALRLDPAYARAHSRLAALHAIRPSVDATITESASAEAERHALRALELDPTLAEPHAVQGIRKANQRRYAEAEQAFQRALALEPDDVTTNFWYALVLLNTGYQQRGQHYLDRVLALDPMLPNALSWRARSYLDAGDIDAAERLSRRAAAAGLALAGLTVARIEQARGRRDAALREMTQAVSAVARQLPPEAPELFARTLLGDAQARRGAVALVDDYLARKPVPIDGIVVLVLFRSGDIPRGLALLQEAPTANESLVLGNGIWADGREIRTAPEFAEFTRRSGLAAWWDVNGPPDLCRKAENGDYVCE